MRLLVNKRRYTGIMHRISMIRIHRVLIKNRDRYRMMSMQ